MQAFEAVGSPLDTMRSAATGVFVPVELPADLPTAVRAGARHSHATAMLVAADTIGVVAALTLGAVCLHFGWGKGIDGTSEPIGWRALLSIPLYLLAFASYGLYRRQRRRLFPTSFPDLGHLAHALVAGAAGTLAASHLAHAHAGSIPRLSLTGVAFLTAPAMATVPAARLGGRAVSKIRGWRTRVIILGSGVVATNIAVRLAGFDDIELLGMVDEEWRHPEAIAPPLRQIPNLGAISDLPRLCAERAVDRVVVAFSPAAAPEVAAVLRQLPPTVQISVVPRLFDLHTWRSQVDELHGLPLIDVAPPLLRRSDRVMKRGLDLAVSTAVLVVGLPVWLTIAAAVKLTSPGPVFFRQARTGRKGRLFSMYKFRTMRVGAEEERAALLAANEVDGPLFKIKQDPRITRVGRFLRATSLDEVPQLLNVIKGDMSLVGPRPFIASEAAQIDGWATRRFDVRPGMTGLWQVCGRNDLPFEELRRLDYAYVASWSLWWDLKIVWQTPGTVLQRRGAY